MVPLRGPHRVMSLMPLPAPCLLSCRGVYDPPQGVSRQLRDLIKHMLTVDPMQRWGAPWQRCLPSLSLSPSVHQPR
jgi:serine/threonine protein kinase